MENESNENENLGTLSYGVKTAHFIRQALAGFAGGEAIVSEMVQNADDAGASCIAFTFTPEALEVFNDSSFTAKDFSSIGAIASGGKRDDEGKIGTWGIGFLSVYHITDAPELESTGRRIVFDPYQHELPFQASDVVGETRFRLPWRKQDSALSKEIEGRTWSQRDILRLQKHLEASIYRLILFTRHVTRIEVHVADRPLAVVSREKVAEEGYDNFQVETWTITYKAGTQSRNDTWFCYRAEVPERLAVSGVTIKDREVRLALPVKSSKWLEEQVPNVLYNFLPVPTIPTGLPFYINGAFFPDNNRNTILLDERSHPDRARWNLNVLRTLGELFLSAVADLRERITKEESIRRFYELLPLIRQEGSVGEVVSRPFLDKAGRLKIVWTSLDEWAKPRDVYVNVRGSRLPDLVSDHMHVLPTGKDVGAPQTFKDFLTGGIEPDRERARWLRWGEVFDFLQRHMNREVAHADAHPMVNTPEKLYAFYKLLDKEKIGAEDRDKLRLTPLCLCEDGRLRRFKDAQWINWEGQELLPDDHGLPLVQADLLERYGGLVRDLTDAFRGRELVYWLQQQSWPPSPFGPGATPLVRDRAHLRKLLRFLDDDLDRVDPKKLKELPLVLTEDGKLRRRGAGLFIHEDEAVRRALTELGFTFVHPELAGDPHVRDVYERMGVAVLTPQAVIKGLGTPPASITDEVLVSLYDYFYRSRGELQEEDKKRLRALPLYRTQKERLVPLEHNGKRLLLPPVQHPDEAGIAVLDKLGLDNTIHSHLANREVARKFLTWLGAKERDALTLIQEEILPHYGDNKLDHTDRLALLRYISDTTRHYVEARVKPEGMPQLWRQLQAAPLIRCADGKYREGHKVNFAGPLFERVFSGTYRHPHPQYKIPVAQEGDAEQARYTKSPWHWLFQALGVNAKPTDADLVRAVEKITQEGSPTPERVQAIQRIYTYLNEELQSHLPDRREGLRKLAHMKWLPARGDEEQWHNPKDLHPASKKDLVGEQGLLLPFSEPSVPLRNLLGIPGDPPAKLVARHLLASADRGIGVADRVYQYLGRGWDELPQTIRSRLQKEAVIWEAKGQRYWTAEKTFFGDRAALYGARRLSIPKPPGGEIQHFLLKIGVKADPKPWEDGVALIREIASDYTGGNPVDVDDSRLLHAQFHDLGNRLDQSVAKRSLSRLRGIAFVPDADARLHPPERIVLADQPSLLEQFPEGTIPLVEGSDTRDNAESSLTQSGVRFLKTAGVAPLSHLVRRYPEDVQLVREEEALSAKLQALTHALHRIFVTHTGEVDEDRFKPLHAVQAWHCSRLKVRHILDNDAGWQVNGSVTSASALYDAGKKQLYFVPTQSGEVPVTAVALELNRIFFPELTASPVIEQLLRFHEHEWETYLDNHHFEQVHRSEASLATRQGAVTMFSDLPEEATSLFSEGSEVSAGAATDTPDTKQQELDLGGDGALPGGSITPAEPSEPAEELSETASSRDSGKDRGLQENGTNGTGAGSPSEESTEDDPTESAISDETLNDRGNGGNGTQSIDIEPTVATSTQPSSDSSTSVEQEEVPPFTGQLRPPVVSLSNNYDYLRKRYGFPKTTGATRPQLSKDEQDDADWQPDAAGETSDEERITRVRFTLHFNERNEGFLRLHKRARKMFEDRPVRLRCLTDKDNEFDLYADYEEGILYNEEALPDFFVHHNIPAGGIVYLERVHGHTVRLFWEKTQTILKDVLRYEAKEDGSVEKFVVANNEYECEVNEAVYRAETRLEDPEAFFLHAKDKDGVLTTLCDAFGESGRVLPYMDVLNAVLKERPAAEATVRWLLHQLDCFVPEEGDRWRFVPENGLGFITASDTSTAQPETKPPAPQEDGGEPVQGGSDKENPTDPVVTLLAAAARDLDAEAKRLRSPGEPQEVFQQFLSGLRRLIGRLEKNFAALQAPASGLQRMIERAEQSDDMTKRWELLLAAWQQHPGAPDLRRAIINALLRDATSVSQEVEKALARSDVSGALAAFEPWRTPLHKLEDAWRESDEAGAVIGPIVRRLFTALLDEARAHEQVDFYCSALKFAALAPPKRTYLNADDLLEAATEEADVLEQQADVAAAAGLMEYTWHQVDSSAVSPAVAYRYKERLSTLWKRLNQFHLALSHLKEAHMAAPSARQRDRLAPELRNLEERIIPHIDQEEEARRLRDELQRLVQNESFMSMVSPSSFAALRRQLQ